MQTIDKVIISTGYGSPYQHLKQTNVGHGGESKTPITGRIVVNENGTKSFILKNL